MSYNFEFIDFGSFRVVRIGNYIVSNSKQGDDDHLWVRREDPERACEGGDFTIDQINEAFDYLFEKYF